MSYKLEYPYTEQERLDFIVQYNHQQGLRIETVDNFVEVETSHYEPNYGDDGEIIEEYLVTDTITENYPTHYALEANEIMEGGEPVINPNYEAEQELKERERIAKLKLTKREVFLGLYQAKGVTPDMIKAQITDAQALIEFEYANDYYRGNPLIDIVGATLGIKPEQLDCFFETNDYTCLLPATEEEEVIDDTNNSTTTDDTNVPVQPQIEDGLQEGETAIG